MGSLLSRLDQFRKMAGEYKVYDERRDLKILLMSVLQDALQTDTATINGKVSLL